MATSTRKTIEIEVTKLETVPAVELVLTEDEAHTLAFILAKIGGDPTRSRRKHCDAISKALERAQIFWHKGQGRDLHVGGQIYFSIEEAP